jgi:hypothetical protein
LTEVDIDLDKVSIDEVVNRFRAAVLPSLQEQPGYRGVYVMGTPEGRGMIVSLWATEQAANATHDGDWYHGVLTDFATFFRQDPGRSTYEILISDVAQGVSSPW